MRRSLVSAGVHRGLNKSVLTFFTVAVEDMTTEPGAVIPCEVHRVKGSHESVMALQEILEPERSRAPWTK